MASSAMAAAQSVGACVQRKVPRVMLLVGIKNEIYTGIYVPLKS
jgi:hypothetical protein